MLSNRFYWRAMRPSVGVSGARRRARDGAQRSSNLGWRDRGGCVCRKDQPPSIVLLADRALENRCTRWLFVVLTHAGDRRIGCCELTWLTHLGSAGWTREQRALCVYARRALCGRQSRRRRQMAMALV